MLDIAPLNATSWPVHHARAPFKKPRSSPTAQYAGLVPASHMYKTSRPKVTRVRRGCSNCAVRSRPSWGATDTFPLAKDRGRNFLAAVG